MPEGRGAAHSARPAQSAAGGRRATSFNKSMSGFRSGPNPKLLLYGHRPGYQEASGIRWRRRAGRLHGCLRTERADGGAQQQFAVEHPQFLMAGALPEVGVTLLAVICRKVQQSHHPLDGFFRARGVDIVAVALRAGDQHSKARIDRNGIVHKRGRY